MSGVRIRRLMQHTCDLYRPAVIAPQVSGDIEGGDFKYSNTKAYSGVMCYYQSTPEYARAGLEGLTKEDSVLVSDKWHFLAGQEIGDNWEIVMTSVAHPDNGRMWVVQGNSQMNASMIGRPADSQWVFAKLSPTTDIPG